MPKKVKTSGPSKYDQPNYRCLGRAYHGYKDAVQSVATPTDLYEALDKEFHFDHDPCPLGGKEDPAVPDGLTSEWGKRNFVNPPYNEVKLWMEKAIEEKKKGKTSVLLIPLMRSKYRRELDDHVSEIRVICGGVKFQGFMRPHPSILALYIYRPRSRKKIDIKKLGPYEYYRYQLK